MASDPQRPSARVERRRNLQRVASAAALTLLAAAAAGAGLTFLLGLALAAPLAIAIAAVVAVFLALPTLRTLTRQLRWLASWDAAAADAALALLPDPGGPELQASREEAAYARQWVLNPRWERPRDAAAWTAFFLTLGRAVRRDTGLGLEHLAVSDTIADRFTGRPPAAAATASAETRARALLLRTRLELKGWELPVSEGYALAVDARLAGFTLDDAIRASDGGDDALRLDAAFRRYRDVAQRASTRYRPRT